MVRFAAIIADDSTTIGSICMCGNRFALFAAKTLVAFATMIFAIMSFSLLQTVCHVTACQMRRNLIVGVLLIHGEKAFFNIL